MLNDSIIREALTKLGERLGSGHDIEILLIGGAAGILTGQLSGLTTADVDAIHFRLATDRDAVLDAAAEVGDELQLPVNWLNDWGALYRWTLPDDWEKRRIEIGIFGRLRVYAVSRVDLISMKIISHREHDLEHLFQMKMTSHEKSVVHRYLDVLVERYPVEQYPEHAGRIEMARQYLNEWKVET